MFNQVYGNTHYVTVINKPFTLQAESPTSWVPELPFNVATPLVGQEAIVMRAIYDAFVAGTDVNQYSAANYFCNVLSEGQWQVSAQAFIRLVFSYISTVMVAPHLLPPAPVDHTGSMAVNTLVAELCDYYLSQLCTNDVNTWLQQVDPTRFSKIVQAYNKYENYLGVGAVSNPLVLYREGRLGGQQPVGSSVQTQPIPNNAVQQAIPTGQAISPMGGGQTSGNAKGLLDMMDNAQQQLVTTNLISSGLQPQQPQQVVNTGLNVNVQQQQSEQDRKDQLLVDAILGNDLGVSKEAAPQQQAQQPQVAVQQPTVVYAETKEERIARWNVENTVEGFLPSKWKVGNTGWTIDGLLPFNPTKSKHIECKTDEDSEPVDIYCSLCNIPGTEEKVFRLADKEGCMDGLGLIPKLNEKIDTTEKVAKCIFDFIYNNPNGILTNMERPPFTGDYLDKVDIHTISTRYGNVVINPNLKGQGVTLAQIMDKQNKISADIRNEFVYIANELDVSEKAYNLAMASNLLLLTSITTPDEEDKAVLDEAIKFLRNDKVRIYREKLQDMYNDVMMDSVWKTACDAPVLVNAATKPFATYRSQMDMGKEVFGKNWEDMDFLVVDILGREVVLYDAEDPIVVAHLDQLRKKNKQPLDMRNAINVKGGCAYYALSDYEGYGTISVDEIFTKDQLMDLSSHLPQFERVANPTREQIKSGPITVEEQAKYNCVNLGMLPFADSPLKAMETATAKGVVSGTLEEINETIRLVKYQRTQSYLTTNEADHAYYNRITKALENQEVSLRDVAYDIKYNRAGITQGFANWIDAQLTKQIHKSINWRLGAHEMLLEHSFANDYDSLLELLTRALPVFVLDEWIARTQYTILGEIFKNSGTKAKAKGVRDVIADLGSDTIEVDKVVVDMETELTNATKDNVWNTGLDSDERLECYKGAEVDPELRERKIREHLGMVRHEKKVIHVDASNVITCIQDAAVVYLPVTLEELGLNKGFSKLSCMRANAHPELAITILPWTLNEHPMAFNEYIITSDGATVDLMRSSVEPSQIAIAVSDD